MVSLLAPASASRLPWVKWEAESHSAPQFGHVSPRWGPKDDSTGRPTTRAACPGPRRESGAQRSRRLGPRDGDAEARCPGSSDTAAARPRRKPPPLAGCGSLAAASWSPRPRGSGRAPGRRHLNPSPTHRRNAARGSGCAVESWAGGDRSPAPPPQARPPAALPRFPGCHTRPGSAGLGPRRALAQPTELGAKQGGGRGGAAGPSGSPRRGRGGAAGPQN